MNPTTAEITYNAYRTGIIREYKAEIAFYSELAESTKAVWGEVAAAVESQVKPLAVEAPAAPESATVQSAVKVAPDAHLWRDA